MGELEGMACNERAVNITFLSLAPMALTDSANKGAKTVKRAINMFMSLSLFQDA